MRRYLILFFCVYAIAACSPRYYHGEQAAVALNHAQSSETTSAQKRMEQYVRDALQQWQNMNSWTDQVSVKEVMSAPDSSGAQHVTERITTTTRHHLESASGTNSETETALKERSDSSMSAAHENTAFREEEMVVSGKVSGPIPWYVVVVSLVGAVVVGLFLAMKKGWISVKL